MVFCTCWPFQKTEKTKASSHSPVTLTEPYAHSEEKHSISTKNPTGEDIAETPNAEDTTDPPIQLGAGDIWYHAYENLKNDENTRELVEEYERILQQKLEKNNVGSSSTSVVQKLADLSDGDREALFNALIQQGVEKTEKSADRRRTMTIIATSVQRTQSVVSSALLAYPPASIAWGMTCLLLGPVFTHTAQQVEARQSGLKYVISRFPWYVRLIDLLNSETWKTPSVLQGLKGHIQSEIIGLYTKLIEYQLQSFRSYYHPVSSFGKNLVKWDDWEGMVQSIKDMETQFHEYISAYTTSAAQEFFRSMASAIEEQTDLLRHIGESTDRQTTLLEDQKKAAAVKQKENLMMKYKPDPSRFSLEIYEDYVGQLARPYNGTGKGVLEHERFSAWVSGDEGILVLAAHPGTGKSVLAKYLVEKMSESSPITVCSFFFKDNNNKGQNKPRVALSKILYEAIKNCNQLTAAVEDKANRLDSHEIHPHSRVYWDLLDAVTHSTPSRRLILVIDALDECDSEQRRALLQALRDYRLLYPTSKIKILLTTRPMPNILEMFAGSLLNMDDDPVCRELINRDIIAVSKLRLERFAEGKEIWESTKRVFLDRITAGNDRTYLYVDLMFKYLEQQGRQRNSKIWDQKFRESPTDLREAYATLLSGVSADHRTEVRRMLEIVMAASRPLTLQEMDVALALHDADHDYETEDDLCSSSSEMFKNWVLEVCGFFLDIYNGRIYFIHLTAKEHLFSTEDRPTWLDAFTIEACHRTLAKSCLAYFSLPFIQQEGFMNIKEFIQADDLDQQLCVEKCERQSEFGNYAFTQWVVHSSNSYGVEEPDLEPNLFTRFQNLHPEFPLTLAMAIFCYSRASSEVEARVFVNALPSGYPRRIEIISLLAKSFSFRCVTGVSGLLELDYAVELGKQTVDETPQDDPMLASRLEIVAKCLHAKARMTGSVSTLDEAIQIANRMVDLIPAGDPCLSMALHLRSKVLIERSRQAKGNLDDVNTAIQDLTQALDITTDDKRRSIVLNTLSLCFYKRYRETDRIEELDEAIATAEESISLNGSLASANNVALFLRIKYKATGNIEDLDRAVEEARKAVTMSSSKDRSLAFTNLASILEARFDLTKDINNLHHAVVAAQSSVDAIPKEHYMYPAKLKRLQRLRNRQDELMQSD
ncbi:uncharacterized protein BO97DRAFT_445569 [Aspergillus homomorphus CBS 101889]|uniref:NACHT domain-containing protein n=1 Tax=Aspergillus homomorphus (strain CBS 101889) TaxID=1450537 RepID=A0A395HNV0_ASPHC|nr:hypothetical protein BO97DRAFT_445569 [Aspergillus homomorphus CBS 101889]RAL09286.1 hypothetical protein BO97DRAFT_445569 [Aspergillus homomorphus CBS 101889]